MMRKIKAKEAILIQSGQLASMARFMSGACANVHVESWEPVRTCMVTGSASNNINLVHS